ncbi:MAG: hypothetical protein ABSE73_27095 [Planctomycetota bacterium]
MVSPEKRMQTSGLLRADPIQSAAVGAAVAEEAHVPYALIGALAVWSYVPLKAQRLTKDADLAVPYGHRPALMQAAKARGLKAHLLSIGGCGLARRGIAVDLIDRHPELAELFSNAVRAARASRRRVKIGSHSVPVVPLPYLAAMKLVTHESKDERDVEELLKVYPIRKYGQIRKLVRAELGYPSAMYLDTIARRIGHPGPGLLGRSPE